MQLGQTLMLYKELLWRTKGHRLRKRLWAPLIDEVMQNSIWEGTCETEKW